MGGTIQAVKVVGNQRIEEGTIRSYMLVRAGDSYDGDRVDRSLKVLFATGLFQDVRVTREGEVLTVHVIENPIVNRVAFEGNHKLNDDQLKTETQLRPRSVFSPALADGDRRHILDLYARRGYYNASVEPKIVRLDQNRVDVVFQIDDGWQKCYGDWTADPKKFPNGMKPIADKVKAAGLIPGIWMTMVTSSSNGAHPDGNPGRNLDPTHPATREFIAKTLHERYAEGYRYFKLDFNNPRWKDRHNQKLTRLQLMRDLFKLYRESIGEDCYLCACVGGLNRGALGYADSLRIGTDSGPRWLPMYSGCCMADLFNAIGSIALADGILFSADPDVTYTVPEKYNKQRIGHGNVEPLPYLPNAVRAWHAYVGLLGGVTMTSDVFNTPPWNNDAAVRMMEILYPAAPERGRAFDGQTDPWHRQFGIVASRPWGNFVSAVLLNPGDEPTAAPVRGVPLGGLGRQFHVWSFWDEKYLGTADENYAAPGVSPWGGALLRFTALPQSENAPVLIGSNLHISMGAAEIKSIDVKADRIAIALTDAGARSGALFFHSRKPLSAGKAAGCVLRAVEPAGKDVWKACIENRRRGDSQSIELVR